MGVSESKTMAETVLLAYQIAEDEGSRRSILDEGSLWKDKVEPEIQTFLLSDNI